MNAYILLSVGKLVPVAYGIKKLQICCVVEDDKVGTDFLEESILEFEDYVSWYSYLSWIFFNKCVNFFRFKVWILWLSIKYRSSSLSFRDFQCCYIRYFQCCFIRYFYFFMEMIFCNYHPYHELINCLIYYN